MDQTIWLNINYRWIMIMQSSFPEMDLRKNPYRAHKETFTIKTSEV